ncbi:AP-1 complex subunit beta-1-like [Watersipora subatra]|uniref:AP-1 complex subunit beta-1-like n=1 Tax=Watersipora subatra TaxID=2589382 RepID=UPI00355BA4B8
MPARLGVSLLLFKPFGHNSSLGKTKGFTADMTDSKYFTTTKKGELFELKAELNSEKRDLKKDAIKKVIASMTVGKDVSQLFPDVVNCGQTDDLELKKLVYLYLINYAKSQPGLLTLMAVNTFDKDTRHPNPLIRALAVRTMGCIRVDETTDYFAEPLKKCLKDEDPYVRKTAAVSVAKLHDINSDLVEEQGFLELLQDLLSDSNPMVVANAVAAISEIKASSSKAHDLLSFSQTMINKLLTALNECTEWGQVFILDCVAGYHPKDERDAQSIIERVTPRLAHANAAVVLSAVKVIMRLLDVLPESSDFVTNLVKKLSAPLVTLLSAEPEIQYIALRNIALIIQRRPDILKHELKVFFVKYNDPIYVKLEKLDIMIRLTNQSNISQTLAELKEYATEVDVDFVRRSVRAIGRCAIKVDVAAERCVSTLLDLIQTKVNYVVQEAIVVIKDIFRKYPNKYESVIGTLCECLDTLDEPEARASIIWIIGEYAERIDNAAELLETFLDSFHDENSQVQLQILTAIVKLFLTKPSDGQDLVQQVLSMSTQESENPDLRDRGYIYWRLLSTSPQAAKEVVLAEKPVISERTDSIESDLLSELISNIGTLASVYHKPLSSFVDGAAYRPTRPLTQQPSSELAEEDVTTPIPNANPAPTTPVGGDLLIGDLLSLSIPSAAPAAAPPNQQSSSTVDLLGGGLSDLLGGGITPAPTNTQPSSSMSSGLDDLLGGFGGPPAASSAPATPLVKEPTQQVWLASDKGKGLEVRGSFVRKHGQVCMELTLSNSSMQQLSGFAIQFNKNSFGLVPASALKVNPISAGSTCTASLPLHTTGTVQRMNPITNLQVAIKNNVDVFYFATQIPMQCLFADDGLMEKKAYLTTWKDIPASNEVQSSVSGINASPELLEEKLKNFNIFTVAKRNIDGHDMLYQSVKLSNGIWCLIEVTCQPSNSTVQVSLKSRVTEVYPPMQKALEEVLRS